VYASSSFFLGIEKREAGRLTPSTIQQSSESGIQDGCCPPFYFEAGSHLPLKLTKVS
jgi:hypothetical protein